MRNYSIYYNPEAGSGRARALVERLAVSSQLSAVSLSRDIVVIGGDGTFNRLLNELERPEAHRYILLPGGTSNSLYSQLSGKVTAEEKMQRYLDGADFQPIDLPELTIGGKTYRFANEAGAGFAAAIAREIESRKTKRIFNALHLNELAYIATAFRCWRKDEPIMLSLCNNRRISGDLYPCPGAQINDGLIDVFELRCPRLRLPYELTRLVGAKADKASPYVTRHQTATQSWHWDKPMPVELDGNPIGETQDIRLSIYPSPIQVL